MNGQNYELIDLDSDDDKDEQPAEPKQAPPPPVIAIQMPKSSSSSKTQNAASTSAANGESSKETKDCSKNASALRMLLNGIFTLKPGDPCVPAINKKIEKKFNKCSEDFRESEVCYGIISECHSEMQKDPSKTWFLAKKLTDSFDTHKNWKKLAAEELEEEKDEEMKEVEETKEDQATREKREKLEGHLERILGCLASCQRALKKLDETEVDLVTANDSDLENSAFIKKRIYESRMVKLYLKKQSLEKRLTNEKEENIHVRPTKICVIGSAGLENHIINAAITKFVNKKKTEYCFPNFVEVKSIISKVNKDEGIGMSVESIESYARAALCNIGQKIKKVRGLELSASLGDLLAGAPDDPAEKDPELQRKLRENKKIGETRMTEILNQYATKSATDEKEEILESGGENNPGAEDGDSSDGESADEDEYESENDKEKLPNDADSKPTPVEVPEVDSKKVPPVDMSVLQSVENVAPESVKETEIPEVESVKPETNQMQKDITAGLTEEEKRLAAEIELWSDIECDVTNSVCGEERDLDMDDEDLINAEFYFSNNQEEPPEKKSKVEPDNLDEKCNAYIVEPSPRSNGNEKLKSKPAVIPKDAAGFKVESHINFNSANNNGAAVNKEKQQKARKSFPKPIEDDCVVLD